MSQKTIVNTSRYVSAVLRYLAEMTDDGQTRTALELAETYSLREDWALRLLAAARASGMVTESAGIWTLTAEGWDRARESQERGERGEHEDPDS